MCCLFKKTAACRQEPCTEAQGVRCCGACPYRKNCHSRCKIPEQMAQKNTPQDEVATGDQLTMEDML